MMDKEPTQEQIKGLWEWCGFRYQDLYPAGKGNWGFTTFPDGHQESLLKFSVKPHPAIDLNNLFKYAVPKLQGVWAIQIRTYVDSDVFHVELLYGTLKYGSKGFKAESKDPALALFWAIMEVIRGQGS